MNAFATAWCRSRRSGLLVAALMLAGVFSTPAQTQGQANKGVPNALQGFSENRGQPIAIEAARLEVRDKSKVATFSGNVKVVQGDTTLRCKSLVVFYEDQATPGAAKAANPGPGGSQQISRLEARGGVVVTQKDQTATGELGLFDMRTNTVTLSGGVVVSQGQNVVQGDKLVVDLTTGVSRVDGKARMLIQQQPGATGQTGPFGPGRPFPN
jgi:lipopolysaccharide export system protein LptA